jgi:tetratricopeptide (TPR) repeat protein
LVSLTAFENDIGAVEDLVARGRYRDALNLCRDVLAARAAARNLEGEEAIAADLQVIERLGELATLQGETVAAGKLFAAYALFADLHGNGYAAVLARLSRAQLLLNSAGMQAADEQLYQLGPFASELDAIECSAAELERWERLAAWSVFPRDALAVVLTRFYLIRGRLLMANGQYRAARMLLQRGLGHCAENSPLAAQRARLALRLALAQACLESGDLDDADGLLTGCNADVNPLTNPGRYVEVRELDAQLALLRGKLGEGVRHFRRVVEFCQQNGFERSVLIAATNLARVEILLNRTAEATQSLQQVRAIATDMDFEEIALRATLLLSVARARTTSFAGLPAPESVAQLWGGSIESEAAGDDAADGPLPELPPSKSFLGWLDDRLLGIHQRLAGNDPVGAKRALTAISRVFGETDSHLIHSRLHYMEGLVAYYQEEYSASLLLLRQALVQQEKWSLLPEEWQARRVVAWCMRRLDRPEEEYAQALACADRLLERLTASLPQSDRAVFLLNKWTAEEEVIARLSVELMQCRQRAATGSRLRRWAAQIDVWRRTAALATRMDLRKVQVADAMLGRGEGATRNERPVSWLSMMTRHSPTRVTLSFLVLPDRVLILQRGFLTMRLTAIAVTRVRLRQVVRGWHESIREFSVGAPSTPDQSAARALRERTLSYLGTELGIRNFAARQPSWVRALTLEPDDILHGFPFAALAWDGRYLVERFACSIRSYNAGPGVVSAGGKEALVVGVSPAIAGLPALRGVRRETRVVGAELQRTGLKVRCVKDSEASAEKFRAALPAARIVHWAGHGVFEIDSPEKSGVLLVDEHGRMSVLSMRELSGLDFSGVQHVTLSSCWSADNFVTPSRWVLSLPQILTLAGAHNVLGCLWEVPDAATVIFMAMFYRQLQRLPIERALQAAQIAWIRRARRRQSVGALDDPRVCAGYILHSRAPGQERLTSV